MIPNTTVPNTMMDNTTRQTFVTPVLIRNTFIFWLLTLAMAFGQDQRDPTIPSAAIQRKLVDPTIGAPAIPANFKVKAIVLSDRDHGTALVETAVGIVKIKLDRQHPSEVTLGESKYLVQDFSSSTLVLIPVFGRDCP